MPTTQPEPNPTSLGSQTHMKRQNSDASITEEGLGGYDDYDDQQDPPNDQHFCWGKLILHQFPRHW